MKIFEQQLEYTEKRLGLKLPDDYVAFLRSKKNIDKSDFNDEENAYETDDGYWYGLGSLYKAEELDLINYNVFEELSEDEFTKDDFSKLIPIFYADGYGGYVVIDTRKNGFGTFLVFHDDEKIEAKFKNFTDFLKNHEDCEGNIPYINYID